MKNRLAIVHCIHHKPWLIMSTLITTLAQNFQEFDIYFLHQVGHGEKFHGKSHEEDFNEYYRLVKDCGVNTQLDSYDPRTKEVCQINRLNVYQIEFENDHGLDSGAWYKFIKKKLWKDYEYVLFMGEGALLTGDTVLNDTLKFAEANNVHFITGSQEKRRFPKDVFLNGFAGSKQSSPMTVFHDKMIGKTFEHFSRDPEFQKTMEQWSSDFSVEQQHHVPDVWGMDGQWLRGVNLFYPNLAKSQPSLKTQIKRFLFRSNKLYYYKLQQESLSALRRSNESTSSEANLNVRTQELKVVANGNWEKLSKVVDFQEEGNVKFHSSTDPAWFGATCNHLVSREFLEKFSDKLESFRIYEVLELPFSATALEIIWGQIPIWLGFEKYFFDGIHRVRKNFITYRREDDPDGMVRYLNRYYRGKIVVESQGDFIKIKQCSDAFQCIAQELNNFYL